MYKKEVIININIVILIAMLMFISNMVVGEEKATNEQIKVLYDKRFDKEIANVRICRYEDNDIVRLYPKVVVLNQLDKELSQDDWHFYRKEVLFLDKEGKITAQIPNQEYFSEVRVSINGLLVAVLRRYIDKPSPYNPALMENWERETKEELTVYNDKAEILWQTDEPLFAPKSDRYMGGISEIDTTIAIDYEYGGFENFSPTKGFLTPLMCKYPFTYADGTKDNRYTAMVVKYRDTSPSVVLLDSIHNSIWEKPIYEQTVHQVKISPKGSYIFAWGTTMSEPGTKEEALERGRVLSKGVSTSIYLFDREGNLILKKNDKCRYGSAVFSDNEKYLAYRVGTTPVMVVTETGEYKRLPITLPSSTGTNPQMLISDNGILYIWHESVSEYQLILVNVKGDIKGSKTFTKYEISGGIDEPKSNIVLINDKLYIKIIGKKEIRIAELIIN